DNNMVKTLPSDRTDEPLRISVLPWRPWRDRSISYAHCAKPFEDDIAIDGNLDRERCTVASVAKRKPRSVDGPSNRHSGVGSRHSCRESAGECPPGLLAGRRALAISIAHTF